MLRDHHEIDPESVGHPKDRAEVLRIGDAVQDEDELRRLAAENLIEVGVTAASNLGDDPVMDATAGEPVDLLGIHLPDRDARLFRIGDGLLQLAPVLA